jgi:hypothetical protein
MVPSPDLRLGARRMGGLIRVATLFPGGRGNSVHDRHALHYLHFPRPGHADGFGPPGEYGHRRIISQGSGPPHPA